jgi:hypothetical protein
MLASTESLSEEVHMQTNYESEFVRTPILENRVFLALAAPTADI